MPTTHILEPTRENLVGSFSRDHQPILTIQSGDTVRYHTLDAGWGLEPLLSVEHRLTRAQVQPREPERDDGHCLTGPIWIEGAKPGMTLAVHIGTILPGSYGFTFSGGWPHAVNKHFGIENEGTLHAWTLNADTMTARNQHGHTVRLRPFLGIMGMPPDEPGTHPTPPPRPFGGNLDCKELIAGTTLYLPIPVEGGLFYAGDGHAAQGDGESSVTAIECPMEHAELTFEVIDDMPLTLPRARTSEGWLAFGLHTDLHEAAYLALENMLALLYEHYGLARVDALALASVTVDLRVTQIANGVVGIHAVLPDGAINVA